MKNQFHLQFNMNCWSVMVKLIRFRKWDFKMTWRFVEIRLIANAGNTNLSTTAHRCWLQYLMCSAASMPPKSNNNKIQTRHTYIYTQIMWLTHILAHTHSRCRCVLSEFYTHFAIYSITCAVFCIKWSLYFSSLFSLFFFFWFILICMWCFGMCIAASFYITTFETQKIKRKQRIVFGSIEEFCWFFFLFPILSWPWSFFFVYSRLFGAAYHLDCFCFAFLRGFCAQFLFIIIAG